MKVLVVDDNRDILDSTIMLLEAIGHDAVGETHWREVQARVAADAPDVVLHDVNMPGLDIQGQVDLLCGPDADPPCHVILFTASVQVDEVQTIPGPVGVMPKPFGLQDLEAALALVPSS